MCGILPCTKTRTETRIDQTIKSIIIYETKPECCKGYFETPDGKCSPICMQPCANGGKCVATNQCACSKLPTEEAPGYAGPTCRRYVCPGNQRWGASCNRECNCPENAYCSANNGKCMCYPGFRGEDCTIECGQQDKHPDCNEYNGLPIMDDNEVVNIDNTVLSRGSDSKADALRLERIPLPDEKLEDERSSFGANYLVGVLACLSLGSVVGFFIYKRRYDKLMSEVCQSPDLNSNSGSSDQYSTGSGGYYASSQYSTNVEAGRTSNNLFSKNLSFAAATRAILDTDQLDSEKQQHINNTHLNHDTIQRNRLIVNPLVESHLMKSHKPSNDNLYSGLVQANLQERPLPLPNNNNNNDISIGSSSLASYTDGQHIYQVPKANQHFAENHDTSIYKSPTKSTNNQHDSVISSNDDIYEEIKPLSPINNHQNDSGDGLQ